MRRTSLLAGLFFIGTFVFSIPAVLPYGPVLKAQYVAGSGADHRVAVVSLARSRAVKAA